MSEGQRDRSLKKRVVPQQNLTFPTFVGIYIYFFFASVIDDFYPPWHPAARPPVFVNPARSPFDNFFFDAPSQFESHDGSSDSTLSPYTDSPTSSSHVPMSSPNYSTASSYSPCQSQNYPPQAATLAAQPHYHNYSLGPYRQYEKIGTLAGAMSPELTSPTNVGVHERPTAATTANASQSPQLSPVFKSEAAKQIIKEMTEKRVEGPRRRQIPREKRRHYTVSSSKPVFDLEDTFSKMVFFFVSLNFCSLSLFLSHFLVYLCLTLSISCHLAFDSSFRCPSRQFFENPALALIRYGCLWSFLGYG